MQYTVSEITSIISTLLGEIGTFSLIGEVSGLKMSSSGHVYFNLKDEFSSISAVIWKYRRQFLSFIPKDGQKVIVTGSVKIYKVNGTYSVDCESVVDAGEGNLLLLLEKRKQKYRELGYFDINLKKQIPKNPKRIGIITSPTGAVIHDFLRVTGRRNSTIDILIIPAPVQGTGAAEVIGARIREINKYDLVDVIVLARGGGSVEDLLPFSEECLIEEIHNSKIPIISAVGHESDWTLADYVSDLRAGTPSIAGELVCEQVLDHKKEIDTYLKIMSKDLNLKLIQAKNKLSQIGLESIAHILNNRLFSYRMELDSHLEKMVNNQRDRLSNYQNLVMRFSDTLNLSISSLIDNTKNMLNLYEATLESLNPQITLDKGFSIVSNLKGQTITNPSQVNENELLNVHLKEGKIRVKVDKNGKNV